MHEPINTSSILVPETSESGLTSSGSFGHANKGSFMLFRSISKILWYSASESGSNNTGFSSHASISRARRSIVLTSPYPSSIIQRNNVTLD